MQWATEISIARSPQTSCRQENISWYLFRSHCILETSLVMFTLIQKKKKEQGKRNEEAYCLFSMLKAQTVHAVRLQRWWVQPLEEKLWFKGSKMSTLTVRPLSLLTIFFGCKSIPFLDTLWPTVIKYMCLYTNWTTKFFLHLSWNLPAMK